MHRRPDRSGLQSAKGRSIAAAIGVSALFHCGGATAAEFCVSCEEPSAHYKCVLPGPAADPSDTRLKLWCMTELAKAGHHASCAIDRQQQAACDGTLKTIALPPGYELGPAPTAPETTAGGQNPLPPQAAPDQHPSKAAAKPAAGAVSGEIIIPKSQTPVPPSGSAAQDAAAAPKTVPPDSGETATENKADAATDAAKGAAEAAGTALNKAGKAVGNAAQKTWTCLSSLFSNC